MEELDVEGVAAEMGVCAETVRRLIRTGRLRAMRAGTRGYRIRPEWIRDYRNSTITA
ncbi:helix-turn-helix domain-containing protein [Tsukamurella soli]|uniref:Helix-turn-helix domain-containing protein n=1 Tax=Tsukamurella soli TaxID=644556 RepID=A0ABP8KIC1_9ACTN